MTFWDYLKFRWLEFLIGSGISLFFLAIVLGYLGIENLIERFRRKSK